MGGWNGESSTLRPPPCEGLLGVHVPSGPTVELRLCHLLARVFRWLVFVFLPGTRKMGVFPSKKTHPFPALQ